MAIYYPSEPQFSQFCFYYHVIALCSLKKNNLSQVIIERSLIAFQLNFELAFLLVSGVKKMKLQTTSKTVSGWMNVRM